MSQSQSNSPAQRGRTFDENVAQRAEEIRKLLLRPVDDILREQTAARAEFDQIDLLRRAESAPHLFELAREKAPENGVHIARRVEIAGLAELLCISRIVTELGIVEAKFHVARKWNGPALSDFLLDLLPQ